MKIYQKYKLLGLLSLFIVQLSFCQIITPVNPDSYSAKVLAVHDGDSYKIAIQSADSFVVHWVRLIGVDAPEVYSPYVKKAQPWGKIAGDSVRNCIKGKTVWIKDYGFDIYHRPLVSIYVDNQYDLSEKILSEGWAWYLPSPDKKLNKILNSLENKAQKDKKGLWYKKGNIKPTVWRKRNQ